MRRFFVAFVAAVSIAVGGLAPAPVAAAASVPATIAGSMAVAPAPAIVSESVTASGSFPTAVARPVILQQKVGASWVRVVVGTSTGSGDFAFPFTAPGTVGTVTTLRTYAPPTTVDGTDYPPLLTPTTTFTTAAQSGVLTWAHQGDNTYYGSGPWVPEDQGITLKVAFKPARAGRRVLFQEHVGGVWTTFGTTTQGPTGIAFRTRKYSAGDHLVRAVTTAANGAPGRTSPTLDIGTYERGSVSLVPDGVVPGPRFTTSVTTSPEPGMTELYQERVLVRDDDTSTTTEVPVPVGMTDTMSGSVSDAGEVVFVAAHCEWEWVWFDEHGGEGANVQTCDSHGIYSWSMSGDPTLIRPGASARVSADGGSLIYATVAALPSPSPLMMLDRETDETAQITPDGYAWRTYRASADFGRVVVNTLHASEAIYLWDRASATRTLIGNGSFASISAGGARVAYLTGFASNPDVAVYDAGGATTAMLGPSMAGAESARVSEYRPLLDASGEHVAVTTNELRGPSYVIEVATGRRTPVSVTEEGIPASNRTRVVGISDDASEVYFLTTANNLDPADPTNDLDLYVWQRP